MKQCILFLSLCLPAFGYQTLDLVAGTGAISGKVTQQNYLAGFGTAKGETADAVYMRETLILAARYSYYIPTQSGAFLVGGEFSGLMTSPTTNGKWKFSQYDTSSKLSGEVSQDFTKGSAPGFNTVRGSLHCGYSIPVSAVFVPELGLVGGIGFGESKYTYQSPVASAVNGGSSNGSSGLSVHAGARFAIKIYPVEALAVGIEYRYLAEAMGSIFSFSPGLQSSTNSAVLTGHLLLLSIGYRFGMAPKPVEGT